MSGRFDAPCYVAFFCLNTIQQGSGSGGYYLQLIENAKNKMKPYYLRFINYNVSLNVQNYQPPKLLVVADEIFMMQDKQLMQLA